MFFVFLRVRIRYGLGWVGWLGVGRDRDLLLVSIFYFWVVGNGEDRDVLFEFINFDFYIFC